MRDGIVGRVVDGRYRVLGLLERGGMATVYTAHDERLDRVIALKIMHASLADDAGFVSRFVREAKSAARLTDPHVVSVFDQGSDDGLVYLVMEYVPGRTVRAVLHEHGALNPSQALAILEPVLQALAAAHRAGLVHRDVKPENVLISDDGRVKVADFGLARAITASTNSTATQGVLIGTVAYLAPEQAEHGLADARSDVYSAGVLLYEMLTGSVPFTGETPLSVVYQHVNKDVPAPSRRRPDLGPAVDELVAHATRREPDQRFSDASDFLEALRVVRRTLPAPQPLSVSSQANRETVVIASPGPVRYAEGGSSDVDLRHTGILSTEDLEGISPASAAKTSKRSGGGKSGARPKFRRRRRGPIALAILIVAALLVGGGAYWFGIGKSVAVPGVIGSTVGEATTTLQSAGLTADSAAEQFSETVEVGRVISTDPTAGNEVRSGSSVKLTVSKGAERYQVPDVVNKSEADAKTDLTNAGLRAVTGRTVYDEKIATGLVVRTDPKVGTPLRPNTAVTLVLSRGPEPIPVPNVVGSTNAAATQILRSRGFTVTSSEAFSDTVKSGLVISVSPKAGTKLNKNDTVNLVVSKGPPPVTIPRVVGLSRSAAVAKLTAVGLKVRIAKLGPTIVLNTVYSQYPGDGTVVHKGDTVTITLV